jgi:hypothetical protein
MRRSTLLIGLAAIIVIAACTDPLAPDVGREPPDLAPWVWHLSADRTGDGAADSELHIVEVSASAPPLVTYEASFWACGWRSQNLLFHYSSAPSDGGSRVFLELTIPQKSITRWPSGRHFRWYHCVEIGVKIDPNHLVAQFEPSGLKFSQELPAQLRISYREANFDLNGDGVVDVKDEQIRDRELGLWRLPHENGVWQRIGSVHVKDAKRFDAKLYQFSQYGVAY